MALSPTVTFGNVLGASFVNFKSFLQECHVCIVGDRVCAVSTDSPAQLLNLPGASSPTCDPPAGRPDCPSGVGAQPAFLESQHPVTTDPGVPPARQSLRRLPLAAVGEVSAGLGGRWEQREVEVSVGADVFSVQTAALSRATAVAEEEPPRQVTRPPDGSWQNAVAVVRGTRSAGPGATGGQPGIPTGASGTGF